MLLPARPHEGYYQMAKIIYDITAPFRKRIIWATVLFSVIIICGFILRPITFEKFPYFFSVVILVIVGIFLNDKFFPLKALCPACGINLFNLISVAKQGHIIVKHCPACGATIEV
jgi:ribosomal protein S27AE